MSAEDLVASYGKQWRADIENEATATRLAQFAVDDSSSMVDGDNISFESASAEPTAALPPNATEGASPLASVEASQAQERDIIAESETASAATASAPVAEAPAQTPLAPTNCTCEAHEGNSAGLLVSFPHPVQANKRQTPSLAAPSTHFTVSRFAHKYVSQ